MTYDDWLARGVYIDAAYRQTHDGQPPSVEDVRFIDYRVLFERDRFLTVDAAMHEAWGWPLPEPPAPVGRRGRVRMDGRCLADDGGCWLPVGLPLFWAVRGIYDGEHDHVGQNAMWAAEQGATFVRVFAETTDWQNVDGRDRRTDPRWPNFSGYLRETRDVLTSAGLRGAWTIFGGNQLSPAEQDRCVADVLAVLSERPEAVLLVEVSNEMNGFRDGAGPARLRQYARLFRDAGFVTTLTSVPHGSHGLYESAEADFANVHFERQDGDRGWRWVRQPWGYPGEYHGVGFVGLPVAFGTLEPGGPGASIHSDFDPERIAQAAVHTFICGGCVHVVHCGAGIFGIQTSHPVGGNRPPDLWNQQALSEAMAEIRRLFALLPLDLPNWNRARHGQPDHPWFFPDDGHGYLTVGDLALEQGQGCVRCYAAYRGREFVAAPIGIMQAVTLHAQHADEVVLFEQDGRSRILRGAYAS